MYDTSYKTPAAALKSVSADDIYHGGDEEPFYLVEIISRLRSKQEHNPVNVPIIEV